MNKANEDAVKAARTLRKAASAALLALLGACLAQCADQPRPQCITTPYPFAVRLIEQSRTLDCDASFGPESFNEEPVASLASYYSKNSKGQPDYDHGTVAIKTAEVGNIEDQYAAQHTALGDNVPPYTIATDGKAFSSGPFTTAESDDSDLCSVPVMLGQTHLVLAAAPAVPDDPTTMDDESMLMPALPAVDIKLEWSNLRVLVTAAMYGTQFEGTLVDTRPTMAGGTCSITYRAVGISNAISCATDMGVDPELCNPIPNPAAGRYTNNGISPLAKQSCDPVIGWCLIPADSPFPALN